MEKTRYFDSINRFNVAVNLFSGNDFPLSDRKETLSSIGLLWVTFVWILQIVYLLTGSVGTIYFANLTVGEMFTKTGTMAAVCTELMIPMIYLNLQRKTLRNLISKYNDILIDSDELRRYIKQTFEPYKTGFIVYIVADLGANFTWSGVPILRMFKTDKFTYLDYTVPCYLPGEPFGPRVFFAGLVMTVVASSSIQLAKIGIDLYVNNFIVVLTAQYKYIRRQLNEALRGNKVENDELTVIAELKKCVRHHCAVIEAGRILEKLLALHIGVIYMGVIFKFCFLAIGLVTLGDAVIEKITYILYCFACLVQLFLLCWSIQELLDTSTSVTDDAFHENWHGRGNIVKKIFCTIAVSSQIECRLSAYRTVELVVPTMALILSKSYSLCLFLLNVD